MNILSGKLDVDFSSPGKVLPFVWSMEAEFPEGASIGCHRMDEGGNWMEVPNVVVPIQSGRCMLIAPITHFSRYAWGSVP